MITKAPLVTKSEIAQLLGLKVRGVENMVARGVIPVIRLSARCVRFDVAKVMAAVERLEVKVRK